MSGSVIVETVKQRAVNLMAAAGRATLHSLYPNDFEYYACCLEVTNSKDEIIDTFTFPVMPSSININQNPLNTIKKTNTGVVSLFNPSFVPFNITISGNFGRKLRLITQSGIVPLNALRKNVTKQEPLDGYEGKEFDLQIKTGYGLCKILSKICDRAYTLDSTGNPYRIYFYNLAFNQAHMVEFPTITFTQDQGTNMIWNYSLSMKAIAPAYATRKTEKSSIINTLSSSVINQGLDALMGDIQGVIDSRLSNFSR
jgi:hypothetical protein